jgi:hypothetical protein
MPNGSPYDDVESWFLRGSQCLYGDDTTTRRVAQELRWNQRHHRLAYGLTARPPWPAAENVSANKTWGAYLDAGRDGHVKSRYSDKTANPPVGEEVRDDA